MKKTRKYSKKGFTLVELIVVLVILAVMAAMLVPALTGYIDEARKKKDYNAAAEALTAAQALVAQAYADPDCTQTSAAANVTVDGINGLCGANTVTAVSGITFASDTDYTIKTITFTINGQQYTWNGSTWNGNY